MPPHTTRLLVLTHSDAVSPIPSAVQQPLTREDVRLDDVNELAFRQFEISDTRAFDRPAAGRSFFEQVIRDHLDVGRPESVSLIFDRRISSRTPGTWRTKVITKGVDPQVNCYYRSSRIKQYLVLPGSPWVMVVWGRAVVRRGGSRLRS